MRIAIHDVIHDATGGATVWPLLLSALLMVGGCGRSSQPVSSSEENEAPAALLRDVTDSTGIDFVHRPVTDQNQFFMPRCIGSGAAFFDYDNDGLLDLYFVQNSTPEADNVNRLYRQTDGHFRDVSAGSGLDVAGYGMGVACGDVNNDGLVDLLLTEYGQVRLFLNRSTSATPVFEDITETAGLINPMWGTSSAFFDYDRDGWLDLIVVNYVNYDPSRWCSEVGGSQEFCGPDNFPGRVTKLFRNLSGEQESQTNVKFNDVTVQAGFADKPGPGLGIFCADFTADRWPDVFIANDGKPNHLWINQRDGTFQEEAMTRGLGYNAMGKSEADMGIAIGDVNTDGMFDIFVTHLASETHTLWSQGPVGVFADRTATSGLTAAGWRGTGFGTAMGDFDNDGDLDLIVANGRVTRAPDRNQNVQQSLDPFWTPYAERDQLMLNRGDGSFVDVSTENPQLSHFAHVSRGLACADYDNNGTLDVLITHVAEKPALLKTIVEPGRNWLLVRAVDPALQRDAYGAELYLTVGNQTYMRWINPGYSYLCSNDPRAHFGLADAKQYEEIRVLWPDGSEERFPGGKANQLITLRRGQGT